MKVTATMISKAKRVEVAVERLDVSAFVVPTDLCNPSETELTG